MPSPSAPPAPAAGAATFTEFVRTGTSSTTFKARNYRLRELEESMQPRR